VGRSGVVILASCLGFFLINLDATIVNVALPAIGRRLHAGLSGLRWVVAGYTLAFAGLLVATAAASFRRIRGAGTASDGSSVD
jgi:DHA2 family methylenomycin A resistance protein-like MFS transporter